MIEWCAMWAVIGAVMLAVGTIGNMFLERR